MPESQCERGLRYCPLDFPSLKKNIWLLQDYDGSVWVDLKSVIEAAGMSWHRWRLVLNFRRKAWGLESCLDRHAKETELIAEPFFRRWLAEIQPFMKGYPVSAMARVEGLREAWYARYQVLAEHEFQDLARQATGGDAPRKRKITAEIVVRLHHERLVVGKSIAATAKSLDISPAAVKAIAAGNYKNMDRAAKEAWRQTFGIR